MSSASSVAEPNHSRRQVILRLAAIFGVVAVAVAIAVQYVRHNAEPILRQRIVETLSLRFHCPVELDRIHISAMQGLFVTGEGLRIPNPTREAHAVPLAVIRSFQFRTDFRALLHPSTSVGIVYVQGLEVHIPPTSHGSPDVDDDSARLRFTISHLICDDAQLFIENSDPLKQPLLFHIQHLELTDIVWHKPVHYDATLINPKPTGLIHAIGTFGPWNASAPRDTPLDGNYDFSRAALNTIRGLGGTLSSNGHFAGRLGKMTIDGVTDTPDFSLDTSSLPLPLHTEFHAIVDGSTGDTRLDSVRARLQHSDFTARGTVLRTPAGHDIALEVEMPNARIEDVLQLAVRSRRPLMRGALTLHARLHVPPGPLRVAQKIQLEGRFGIDGVSFTDPVMQAKINNLSQRAQGHPAEPLVTGDNQSDTATTSAMRAEFVLRTSLITVRSLRYQIPGALLLLDGVYGLDGQVFEFNGHARTVATASQMTTGWKSILLQVVDPLLKKNGAGMEIPVSISGTGGDFQFGLALQQRSTEEMKQDLGNIGHREQGQRPYPRPWGAHPHKD